MQQPRISHRASGRGICSAAVPLCAPAQASMPPRDLQRTLARLAAAAAESPATPATVRGLAADIRACSEQVMKLQGAELIQLRAYYHLGQMALLPCRVVAAATTTLPDVAPEVLHALGNVTGAIVFVDSACSDANGEPQFPSGAQLQLPWPCMLLHIDFSCFRAAELEPKPRGVTCRALCCWVSRSRSHPIAVSASTESCQVWLAHSCFF